MTFSSNLSRINHEYLLIVIAVMINTIACAMAERDLSVHLAKLVFANDEAYEDSTLGTVELVKKHGYPIETHKVVTEDGYILILHRIPQKKRETGRNPKPVMVMHGTEASSAIWVLDGPKRSLGYLLHDAGYDVWLGNFRGNYYTRGHTKLDADNSAMFWNFTIYEMALYDVPAMIDHVLKHTRHSALHYIGHSQGALTCLTMASVMTEYNAKLSSVHALAPIMYTRNRKDSTADDIDDNLDLLQKIGCLSGLHEVFPRTPMTAIVVNALYKLLPQVIIPGYMHLQNVTSEAIDVKRIPAYITHSLFGAGLKQLLHFAQGLHWREYRRYDYGPAGNMDAYGTKLPPPVLMTNVTAPVYIHYSKKDTMTNYKDLMLLHNELGNSQGIFSVKSDKFVHINFIYGYETATVLYEKIIGMMKKRD